MPRLQEFVECIGTAVCEYASAALAGLAPFETALLDVARATHRQCVGQHPADLRFALREIVSAPAETVELAIQDAVGSIRPAVPDDFRESLISYLELLPEVARQAMRRPGDPAGASVPEQFSLRRAEDWLLFLPDRRPVFRPGDTPFGLDNWRVDSLRGFGPYSESWDGNDDLQAELSPACLKFITDPSAKSAVFAHEALLRRILDLDVNHGLIPLRSAYLLEGPPCLEYVHLSGYDLANLMHDAVWRADRPRPDQAATIARRIARVVGKLHRLDEPLVHRGLKASNVLLCPTSEGKVSVWVSDIGWGQVSASLGAAELTPEQVTRRALRGTHGPVYASPQQAAGEPPDPRDDVYAIGVLWYQLLARDPAAGPPENPAWAVDFRRQGLTDGQAGLLMSCLAADPEDRPIDGFDLAGLITANTSPERATDSGILRIKGTSTHDSRPVQEHPIRPRLRLKMPPKEGRTG